MPPSVLYASRTVAGPDPDRLSSRLNPVTLSINPVPGVSVTSTAGSVVVKEVVVAKDEDENPELQGDEGSVAPFTLDRGLAVTCVATLANAPLASVA
jgi:hypothetical protein